MRVLSPTSKTRFRPLLTVFDALWVLAAPLIAVGLREPRLLSWDLQSAGSRQVYEYALITVACAAPAIALFRLGESMTKFFSAHDLGAIFGAALSASAASAMLTFVVNRLDNIPRSTPLIYAAVLVVGFSGGRIVASWLHREGKRSDFSVSENPMRRVLLVGVDRFGAQLIRLLDAQVPRTVQIIAALDDRPHLLGRTVNGVRVVAKPREIAAIIEEYAVHGVDVNEVWASDAFLDHPEAVDALDVYCVEAGVEWRSIASALNLEPQRALDFVAHAPTVAYFAEPRYFLVKRIIDIAAASALLLLLAPIVLIVAGFALADVGAPVLFWQERIGRGGKKFLLFKVRTYRAPFDAKGQPLPESKRVSRIGRAIRATRLDEIPQLYNILRGDMSLIGPRPLLPVDQPADPRVRLSVRPGVTGWAQINGGVQLTPEEKDALDVWYIRHASLSFDLRIAWRTIAYFVHGERRTHAAVDQALNSRHSGSTHMFRHVSELGGTQTSVNRAGGEVEAVGEAAQ